VCTVSNLCYNYCTGTSTVFFLKVRHTGSREFGIYVSRYKVRMVTTVSKSSKGVILLKICKSMALYVYHHSSNQSRLVLGAHRTLFLWVLRR
jgi:hypothetical protein